MSNCTHDELKAIRERDAIAVTFDSAGEHTHVLAAMGDIDRRALLAHVDHLTALLRDAGRAVRIAAEEQGYPWVDLVDRIEEATHE